MAKFNKGNTYLCRREGEKKWYIVHQSGQRSWTATLFTHTYRFSESDDDPIVTMNGTALYLEFANGDVRRFNAISKEHQKLLRETMFNILKHGEAEEQDKELPR